MASDRFVDARAYGFEAITPSDSTDLTAKRYRGLYVGTPGDVALESLDSDTPVVFKDVFGMLVVEFAKVNATDTTASNIVGLL